MVSPLLIWWVINRVVAVSSPPPDRQKEGGGESLRRPTLLDKVSRGHQLHMKFKYEIKGKKSVG